MKMQISESFCVFVVLLVGETFGHWCHKCRDTDNESCLRKQNRCSDGDYCASTFKRTADFTRFTMVRKRCAKNCRKPSELDCNAARTDCTYCCEGDGCNMAVLPNTTDTDLCRTLACTTESTEQPPAADHIQQILMSHHEHMRARVAFSVHSDAVNEGYGQHHVVRFINIYTNIGGLFDGMSNLAELTIKKSGLYHLSVHVVAVDGGDSKLLTLKQNGHALLHSKPHRRSNERYILPTGFIQTVLQLDKNDRISLSVEQQDPDSTTSPSDVIFNGYLID